MPIGTAFMNLQFSFFSGYIVMFIIGIISKRLELFDNIDYRTGKKWLIKFGICYACFTLFIIFGVSMMAIICLRFMGILLLRDNIDWSHRNFPKPLQSAEQAAKIIVRELLRGVCASCSDTYRYQYFIEMARYPSVN